MDGITLLLMITRSRPPYFRVTILPKIQHTPIACVCKLYSMSHHALPPVSTTASKAIKKSKATFERLTICKTNPRPNMSTPSNTSEWWREESKKSWKNTKEIKPWTALKQMVIAPAPKRPKPKKTEKRKMDIFMSLDICMLPVGSEEKTENS